MNCSLLFLLSWLIISVPSCLLFSHITLHGEDFWYKNIDISENSKKLVEFSLLILSLPTTVCLLILKRLQNGEK